MFLYFSDWTSPQNISRLENKRFPHTGKLIKVFAKEQDPSINLNRHISTAEFSGEPFNQAYRYPGRGYWLAIEMERYLLHYHLPEEANNKVRALFRFANSPEMEIASLAMSIRNAETDNLEYSHPLKIIDGLDEAVSRNRNYGLHLDIFTPRSISRLKHFVDLDDPSLLVTEREAIGLEKITPEGTPPNKETR